MTWREKLLRPEGLATTIGRTEDENIQVICCILQAYQDGTTLERAERTNKEWSLCLDVPMNFETYRYRVAQS